MQILVNNDGLLTFVYADELADLIDEGTATIKRASNVEPVEGGGWQADMLAVGGPVLLADDGRPFRLRSDALAAEVHWLTENVLGGVG